RTSITRQLLSTGRTTRWATTTTGACTMNRIEIDASTDETGSIRIRLPQAPAHYPVHVVIEWADVPAAARPGWPPGWFEATAGSIDDPTFVRPPQGAYEEREGFE